MRLLHAAGVAAVLALGAPAVADAGAPAPLDPQNWTFQDNLTWSDYKPLPGPDYSDPSIQPSVKKWKVALVLTDFPDKPFYISQPAGSTIYGTPTLDANSYQYFLTDQSGAANRTAHCPQLTPAKPCTLDFRTDARAAWVAAANTTPAPGQITAAEAATYDNIFYVSAGEDESATWQEFGSMKFKTQADVTDDFGPKQLYGDLTQTNWAITRYVPWSSWAAVAGIWPNANGNTSIEAEASGMATYAHELTHNLGLPDNYNNPFNTVQQVTATGMWDMMSRGSFNGPGGQHQRYLIPPTQGEALGSQHNVRNKRVLNFITDNDLLRLNRDGLKTSGMAVADVTARETAPAGGEISGVNIALDGTGDNEAPCIIIGTLQSAIFDGVARAANGTISGKWNNYTMEVVQQIDSDSFDPGHGVLISKTKTNNSTCGTFSCFVWVVDSHPEDINQVDYVAADGTVNKATAGDERQKNDGSFNAGLGSGSTYEYEDTANRLHFYIINKRTDAQGILHYTVGVRSLDGKGPQTRGVSLGAAQLGNAEGY